MVCSNSGKRAVDLAQMWELEQVDDFRKLSDADYGIEDHGTPGFWPYTKGLCEIAEQFLTIFVA